MQPVPRPLATYEEYLKLEAEPGQKNEFYQGHILAMPGGTIPHALLITNVTGQMVIKLAGLPGRPHPSNLRVRVPATTLATYPDLSVICGPVEHDAQDKHAAINPTVLFEVLSPSTSAYDRGQKFENYRQLPTLRHYVLVESERVKIEVYSLNPAGRWELSEYGAGDDVALPSIEVQFSVDATYEGWAPTEPST